ncbi:MAG: hypothetical protein RLZZ352_1491 [Pseudomonadota bacterium]|jgi:cell division protein FtsN
MKTLLASPVTGCIQRGGTLVGFVVGLVVGLAVALVVAMYVTHVPVPFVDRGLARDPAQDSQEAQRNQGWNPNAVLGNTPPPPAEPSAAPSAPTPSAPGASPATPAAAAPAAPATSSKPAAATPSTDPLGDLAQARSQASTKPVSAVAANSTDDPFTYFVQAGAFRTDEDAQAQRAKLAMLGIEAQVSEREQSGRTVFRVRVGPFKQKAQAEALQAQLQAQQMDAALVRVQP